MTVIARRIRAAPVRMPTEAWALIVDLIASTDEEDMRPHLELAGNAASMVISEEHSRTDPMILSGCGPQVRIYTLHGMDAIDGGQANELGLSITPTASWVLALPAAGDDIDLVATELEGNAHVLAYDPAKGQPTQPSTSNENGGRGRVVVDLTALEQ